MADELVAGCTGTDERRLRRSVAVVAALPKSSSRHLVQVHREPSVDELVDEERGIERIGDGMTPAIVEGNVELAEERVDVSELG